MCEFKIDYKNDFMDKKIILKIRSRLMCNLSYLIPPQSNKELMLTYINEDGSVEYGLIVHLIHSDLRCLLVLKSHECKTTRYIGQFQIK